MSPISLTPAPDGTPLANYAWPAAPNLPPPIAGPGTPSIYLLHGLSEHAGRYDRLARWLAARGWEVGAHDHRGHGHSGGPPATLRRQDDLVADAVDRLRAWTLAQGRAPIVLGHSLGALVAVRIALHGLADIDALVLSSPPFVVNVPLWVRRTLTWMSLHAPDLRVPHGLAPARISHDRAVVRAYRSDPLVRRRMTGRLARFVDEGGRESLREAPLLPCRTLLMVAGTTPSSPPRAAASSPSARRPNCSRCAGTTAPGTRFSTKPRPSPTRSMPTWTSGWRARRRHCPCPQY